MSRLSNRFARVVMLGLLGLVATPATAADNPHGYIVVFEEGTEVAPAVERLTATHGVAELHRFHVAVQGFSFHGSERAALAIAGDSDVAWVEGNGVVGFAAPKFCANNPDHPACSDSGTTDPPPSGQTVPWGIERVGGPLGSSGHTAWVIDSGVDLDHPDLNVDLDRSVSFVSRGKYTPDDRNGHGTHVAGTIAALDNDFGVVGVSPGDPVVSVRVLDQSGSGTYSAVIAGVDYVMANASPGDVANLSLGGSGHVESLHQAVVNLADTGVYVAIAAGNDGVDAETQEPAHVEHANVWTVSAADDGDCMPYWSNWGNPPVDFAAPGVDILSTYKGGDTTTMSGTSMASPHVAGLLLHGHPVEDGTVCADPDGIPDAIAHH